MRTEAAGSSLKLTVDLEKPLPKKWAGKVGFNLELFPGQYFGEHYSMDGKTGVFPSQACSGFYKDGEGNLQAVPMAEGKEFTAAAGDKMKEIKFVSLKSDLQLIDGRSLYNNGWFVLRSVIPAGAVKGAVEWVISAAVDTSWRYKPVIQVSQVGYHPRQVKFALIELDGLTEKFEPVSLIKITDDSSYAVKTEQSPVPWGNFLRYKYLRFDFSGVTEEGLFKIKYGKIESHEFEIKKDIYSQNVWQPTLEYFLPVQMCHVKVEDRYRVWHGLCHYDDARMAPLNHNHFDGYFQHGSTLTKYGPGEHVPGLNEGGWHDAGDYDLRIESQAGTVYKLCLAYEFFKNDIDRTSVDEINRLVQLNKPDGKPDILEQIEHGLLTITGGYEALGRLYRGIICPTLKQYTLLGDAMNMTDNIVYKPGEKDQVLQKQLPEDDRWVFTEDNPERELYVASVLAASYRVMREFSPELAVKCLKIAEKIYKDDSAAPEKDKINAAAELYLSTSKKEYAKTILDNKNIISRDVMKYAIVLGRAVKKLNDEKFTADINKAVSKAFDKISEEQKETPYGVPYKPYIWGAGWGIQSAGVDQIFLYLGFPEIFKPEYALNALNFVLGVHPGENNSSFVSGVGVKSLTTAYGANRADWSYIPGGVGSGTALIRPDLPELKLWPYFWQQTEYVMGGGATDFLLLAMAADYILNR